MNRTSCSCDKCQHGCKVMPAYLLPQDIEGYLQKPMPREGVSTAMWLRYNSADNLLASEGGLVGMVNKLTGEVTKFRVPTLVPTSKPDGSCVHYRDGKCGVHKQSPSGCSMFNACAVGGKQRKQDKLAEEFQMRLLKMWSNFTRGEASEEEEFYCRLWKILWDKGRRRENVQDVTNKYQEGII